MKNKNKRKAIIGALIGSGVALTMGTLALFTDFAQLGVSGTGGRVEVEAYDLNLENAGNINPGDNDEKIAKTYIPTKSDPLYQEDSQGRAQPVEIKTTPHDLTFTVENKGNKSIRTRHTIIVSVEDKNGGTLDPSVIEILKSKGVELGSKDELGEKFYISANGDESKFPGDNVVAIKYVLLSDIFDGVGNNIESEAESTVKNGRQEYTYLLKMDSEAKNKYQGAKVKIDTIIDAMQYRNTSGDDWVKVSDTSVVGELTGMEAIVAPKR